MSQQQDEDNDQQDITGQQIIDNVFFQQEKYDLNSQDASDIEHEEYSYRQINLNNKPFHNTYIQQKNNFLESPQIKQEQLQQIDYKDNLNQTPDKFHRNSLTEPKKSQEHNPVIVMEELIQQTRNEQQNQNDFNNQIQLIERLEKDESEEESSEDDENKIVQISAEQRRSLIREERYKEMEKFIDRNVDKYDLESQEEDISILIDQDSIQLKNKDNNGNKQPLSISVKSGRQNNDIKKRCVSNPRAQRLNPNPRDSIQKADQLSIQRQQKKAINSKQNQFQLQKKKKKKLVFNTYFTLYPVIDLAAKNLGFKTEYKDHLLVPSAQVKAAYRIAPGIYANIPPEEFDVVWFDCPTKDDVFQKLKPYQRISQIPGIQVLSSKAKLARNLNFMQRHFPNDYNFFPKTFLLPQDILEFRRTVASQNISKDVFIVKPSHQCQGKGIHLVKNWDDYQEESNQYNGQVAQLYLDDPYLIDGLKFDLRIYVLVFGIHPLRIYVYNDGLARFATTPYESVQTGDIKNLFMHLTNYSINKNSQNYVQNENFDGGTGTTQDIHQNSQKVPEGDENYYGQTGGIGEQTQTKKLPHKRSLKQVFSQIKEQSGQQSDKLEKDIEDLIIKTIITGQPHLYQTYMNLIPDDIENQNCFQVLGFDVMIDSKLKPWLIEINQSPSFATDSAFDFKLKKKLMEDTFKLLNLCIERKNQYQQTYDKSQFERLMSSTKKSKPNFQEKEFERYQIDLQRDKIEQRILMEGEYKFIFPVKNQVHEIQQYTQFLRCSKEIYYQINGKKIKYKEENIYDMLLKSQLTKRLERQQTFSQIKNMQAQNYQEIQNKFLKISEKKKDLIKTSLNVEQLKKEQITFYKPKFDEMQNQKDVKTKNLGKAVFGNQNESKIEILAKNIESQKKTMSDFKNKLGLQFEFSKNPYIISSKNFENYNQRLKELKDSEFSENLQQIKNIIDAPNQSPKQKNRPVTSNQRTSGQNCKTPIKYQSKPKLQNNYQKILHDNRISLNFQAQNKKLIAQKTEKKEIKNKIISNESANKEFINNYNEKKNQYKQNRVNNKINADLTSAIHSVDFVNKKSYISQNFNSFLDQKSNQSNLGDPKIQVQDSRDKEEKFLNDFSQKRKSFDFSPTFASKNHHLSQSPFTIEKQKYQPQEESISQQIYNGFQKELERLQKIENVLKKDAVIQKQPSDDQINDDLPYQYKTPQRIKKLFQNIEKSTPEIISVAKTSQKLFPAAIDQQKNVQHTKIQGNVSNLMEQNEKDRKTENKKIKSSQSTNRNIQNSQKIFKTLDNKLDYQVFNNKRKGQDIHDVKIQVVDSINKINDRQNDAKTQQHIPNVQDSGKIFKKMIETQKLNGCDPVFDLEKDFKFEKNIGQGAYSNVKTVTHIQSGFKVAIKTYEKSQLRRKSQLMAIHREIYILAKMDHPNIMKLYEVLDSNTHVNFVLQLCSGIKLNQYLQKYGTKGRIGINNNTSSYLSEAKSKYIFRQIVEAVNYMHLQGIAHRDLRIETIIISESNSKIKMVDFGFATSFDFKFQVPGLQSESQEDLISQISKGTEVVKSRLISCQLQDCYNLGIILFILLTGGLPIWAQIESEIFQKIIAPKYSLPLSQTSNRGYDNFSKECQDLISKLFKCDQSNQITLQEVLKCDWLQQNKN